MDSGLEDPEVGLVLHQLLETSQWGACEEFLLKPEARSTLMESDDEGCLPLHYAGYYNAPWHIVEEMITLAPASLEVTTNSDYTPLEYASFDDDEGGNNDMFTFDEAKANREKVIELLSQTKDEVIEGLEDDMLTGNSSVDDEDFRFFREHLHTEFKKCDVDGDGTVSEPEFRLYLRKFMKERNMAPIPKEDIDKMLRTVDLDGNGSLDFDEFCQMLNMSSQLHDALAKQHWNVARRRIALNPNECCLVDMLGQSPLHYAIFCNAPEEILLRLVIAFPGALSKGRVSDNMTPVEYAESMKEKFGDHYEAVTELLKLDPESVYEHRDSLVQRADYLQHTRDVASTLETRQVQFAEIDADGDGQISHLEFKKYLKAQASRRHLYVPSDDDIKELIAEVDTNKDGQISYDEFVAMMESDAKPLHEACAKSRWSAVRDRLHTHHEECHFVDTYGQLPLHYAAYSNITEEICIRMLCEYPEAANVQRFLDGRTPLDFAKLKQAPVTIIELLSLPPEEIIERKDELLERAENLHRSAMRGTREKLTLSMRKHDLDGINEAIRGMEVIGLKNDPATRMARNTVTMLKNEQKKAREEIEASRVTTREKMALEAEENAKLESEKARLKANALVTKAVHHITNAQNETKLKGIEDEALKAKEKADKLKAQADKLSKGTKSIKDRLKREEQRRIKAERAQKQAEEEMEMALQEKQKVEAEKRNLARLLKKSEAELEQRRASMNAKLEKIQTEHQREIEVLQSSGGGVPTNISQHSITIERNSEEPLHTQLDGGAYVDIATAGKASQSGNGEEGTMPAEMAIRGYRKSKMGFKGSGEYAHTCATHTPWWQVELLPEAQSVKKVSVFGRPGYGHRMCDIKLQLLDSSDPDDKHNVLYEVAFPNRGCEEAFSVSFSTSIERVKVVRIIRTGRLKTTDERLLNLNAVQVFAAISVNEFIKQRSQEKVRKLEKDQQMKLMLLENDYQEKLKVTTMNNENALRLGLQLQVEVDNMKEKEAAARAEAAILKEKAAQLEKERVEKSALAERLEAEKVRAEALAKEDEELRTQSEEEIRKREEIFELEKKSLIEGQERAMKKVMQRRRSMENKLEVYQNAIQREIADMNVELGKLERQLAKIEEEEELNVGRKEERTMRRVLCNNAMAAARERIQAKNDSVSLHDAFLGISGIQPDSIAEEAPLKDKLDSLRMYSRSIEILIDLMNDEIENSLSEYNRVAKTGGSSTIAASHKQSLSNKIQRLQLHFEDLMATKALEVHYVRSDAESLQDVKATFPRVRYVMQGRTLDYYKLERNYFGRRTENNGVIKDFAERTRLRSEPHNSIGIDMSKMNQGQLDMNSIGSQAIHALPRIYGRVDKTMSIPKLILMVPNSNNRNGTSLQVLCACDGSVACSFPFNNVHREALSKIIAVVIATAKFLDVASSSTSTLHTGHDEYPRKVVRMMNAVADASQTQRTQIVTTSDYQYFKDWFSAENRMDVVKENMTMVKDSEGNLQFIKKANQNKWVNSGGRLMTKSAINTMIKLQSMRESDYAGFLEKRGKGASAFGSTAFKRRYWILKGSTMLYFDATESNWKESVEKGMLTLDGAIVSLMSDGRTFTISYPSLPSARVWVLRATNRMERDEWMNVIQDAGVIEIKESVLDDEALLGGGTKGCCIVA